MHRRPNHQTQPVSDDRAGVQGLLVGSSARRTGSGSRKGTGAFDAHRVTKPKDRVEAITETSASDAGEHRPGIPAHRVFRLSGETALSPFRGHRVEATCSALPLSQPDHRAEFSQHHRLRLNRLARRNDQQHRGKLSPTGRGRTPHQRGTPVTPGETAPSG